MEHLHRLVRQIQAGNLQCRRLLLFHKGCHRHLLLDVLLPGLVAERLLHGQFHGGQYPGAVFNALGQLVAKANAFQNVQARAQMNGQLAAFQIHPAFIQKAVDRQPLLLQFLDQVHHGGRRDLPKGEQAVHGDFKPRKSRSKRQGQLLAQGGGQRHRPPQIDVDLLALAQLLYPVHQHLGKACSKGRVLPKLGPQVRHQRLHRRVLLSFVCGFLACKAHKNGPASAFKKASGFFYCASAAFSTASPAQRPPKARRAAMPRGLFMVCV